MDRLLTIADVMAKLQRGRTAIYADVRAGKFPKPVQAGANATRWRESDLLAWMQALPSFEPQPLRKPKRKTSTGQRVA